MKKFLLLAALAASISPAFAEEFSDSFVITYDGQTYTNGQTITCDYYYDPLVREYPEYAGMFPPEYESKAEVFATNVSDEPKKLEFRIQYVTPTQEEFASNSALGSPSLCFFNQGGEANCLPSPYEFNSTMPQDPVSAEEYMRMDVEQVAFTDLTPVTLQLDLRVMDDDQEIASATVFINFSHQSDVTDAVEGIVADTKAEYFTIQGVRVAEPQKGQIYIERKGGKVTKHIF